MNGNSAYRFFAGLLLLLSFLLSLGARGLHILHELDEARFRCEANEGSHHVHDERYAHVPCFLCLTYQSQLSANAPAPPDEAGHPIASFSPDYYAPPHALNTQKGQSLLRGPPVV